MTSLYLEIKQGIAEANGLFGEACAPFPYDDCRRFLQDQGDEWGELIPDLDYYLSSIAGYAAVTWVRALKLSLCQLVEGREVLSRSFVDVFPEYKPIESLLMSPRYPRLRALLERHEKMRSKMLEVIVLLEDRLSTDCLG